MFSIFKIACVAGVERGRGNLGARERRVVSRPNSPPLPFRTPATQAIFRTSVSVDKLIRCTADFTSVSFRQLSKQSSGTEFLRVL